MKNHLKIIRMLYSSHLFTESLLAIEFIIVVQLLALSTNCVSYQRQQLKQTDSLWGKDNYLYYSAAPYAQDIIDPDALIIEYPEIKDFYQGNTQARFLRDTIEALKTEDGHSPQVELVHYNTAMLEKTKDLLEICKEIDPGDTIPVCVSPEVAKVCPPGTVLTLGGENRLIEKCTVCGTILSKQIPVTDAGGGLLIVDSLTINSREQMDLYDALVFIAFGEEDIPITGGMFRLENSADGAALAEELTERCMNEGDFYPYSQVSSNTRSKGVWLRKSDLLEASILLLIFVSHFVVYLSTFTRNKERTNALLLINGVTPMKLAGYNAASLMLILIPSFLVGILIIPFAEIRWNLPAYGGHSVLWMCLAAFAVIAFLLVYLTVAIRIKRGSSILLYKKGT